MIQLCDDLMQTSVRVFDNIVRDLEKWGNDDKKRMAAILGTQRHTRTDFCQKHYDGQGAYINKAFFVLPSAYRLIASLHQPLKQWNYNKQKYEEYFTSNTRLLQEMDWRREFFREGTIQHQWRMMWIERQIQLLDLIGKDNIRKADDRFLFHFCQDNNINKPQWRSLPRPT